MAGSSPSLKDYLNVIRYEPLSRIDSDCDRRRDRLYWFADVFRMVFVVWAAAGRYSLRRRARTILRAAGFDVADFSGIERHSLFAAEVFLSHH